MKIFMKKNMRGLGGFLGGWMKTTISGAKSETKKVWDTLLVMVGKSNQVRGQPDSDDNTTLTGRNQAF